MRETLEDYFVALNPPAYWKKLAFRYPGMVRELRGQMRMGVENDQAVINSVLTNGHAPDMYRAATVRNQDAWYDAFAVKPEFGLASDRRMTAW